MHRLTLRVVLLFVTWSAAAPGQATRPAALDAYYVSPRGAPTGDGTFEKPWPSVEFALDRVGGGRTIVLLPGDYTSIRVFRRHSGQPDSPTVIRAAQRWKARILPARRTFNDSWENGGVWFEDGTSDVVLEGLQIAYALTRGVDVRGHRIGILNCWIHHCGMGDSAGQGHGHGITAFGTAPLDATRDEAMRGLQVEGCVVEYCGSIRSRTKLHGIYGYGIDFVIRNNIFRYNGDCGVSLGRESFRGPNDRPRQTDGCTGAIVEGNLCYGNANAGIQITYPQRPQGAARPNTVTHNTCFANRYGLVFCGGASAEPNRVYNNIFVGNMFFSDRTGRWVHLPVRTARWQQSGDQSPFVELGHNLCDASPVVDVGRWIDAGGNRFDVSWGSSGITAEGLLLPDSPARGMADRRFLPRGWPQADVGAVFFRPEAFYPRIPQTEWLRAP